MSNLQPELKRMIAAARKAKSDPWPADLPPGLVTRVLAAARPAAPEELSNRFLGAIFLSSAALALVWVFVFLASSPAGSDQTFNEIATRMVTSAGR